MEGALQSTQKDGMLTVDQALVKQAWERVSNKVREAGWTFNLLIYFQTDSNQRCHVVRFVFNYSHFCVIQ